MTVCIFFSFVSKTLKEKGMGKDEEEEERKGYEKTKMEKGRNRKEESV